MFVCSHTLFIMKATSDGIRKEEQGRKSHSTSLMEKLKSRQSYRGAAIQDFKAFLADTVSFFYLFLIHI